MRALFSVLSIAATILIGCTHAAESGDTNNVPLTIYVVSEERIEGGKFIDTPDFPKLGYIAAAPDLVISRLQRVVPQVVQQTGTMIDKDGKRTTLPTTERLALNITMQPDDAKKFTAITERAIGKKTLLMLGDTLLIAPAINEPIATPSLLLTLGEKPDKKKVEDELKRLVK